MNLTQQTLDGILNLAEHHPQVFWTLVAIGIIVYHATVCWWRPFKRCRWCEGGRVFDLLHRFYRKGCMPIIGCGGGGEKIRWGYRIYHRVGLIHSRQV